MAARAMTSYVIFSILFSINLKASKFTSVKFSFNRVEIKDFIAHFRIFLLPLVLDSRLQREPLQKQLF